MQLQPGTYLQGDKYRIIRALGSGGFGISYLAEHELAERKVCIKEFFPREFFNRNEDSRSISLGSQGSAKIMDAYKAKFMKEAKTIARLDHPNIIHIHDVFEENNTAYYVMEYIDGESLSTLVRERGALAEAEAINYIRAVAEALGYIHDRKIMHLDIKPANVMLRKEDGRTILIDFGLSKQYDAEGNQTSSTPVGISAGYAPMEQYQQGGVKEFSPETDIYSLGATLYYLVTGQVPPQAVCVADEGLPELPAHLSSGVRDAIEQSMEIQRRRRPHSIKEFLALLDGTDTLTPNIETTALHIEVADSKTELLPKVEPSKPVPPRQEIQPNNEIWYTSSYDNIVEPHNQGIDIFGAEIVSNTYKDGKGIIKFEDDVTTIGFWAFAYCSSLTSITIPNSATTIENNAFYDCNKLKSVTIPNNVTTIESNAFYGCKSLTSVTIPNSVTTIGEAFCNCIGLKEFKGKYAADAGRCLIKDNTIIAYANASGTTYDIPNSVKAIGNGAFSWCLSLTSVTIPNSVTTIEGWAFSSCKSLTSITIPNSVTTIGDCAFYGCQSLKSVTIPNSVTTIEGSSFKDCDSLTSITIPDSVTTIEFGAFKGCCNLTSVTIPNSVTTIGLWAFEGCKKLSKETKKKIKSINLDAL